MKINAVVLASIILFSVAPAYAAEVADAFDQNRKLGRGVNIIGYDPIPGAHGRRAVFRPGTSACSNSGVQRVRINLFPFDLHGSQTGGRSANNRSRRWDSAVVKNAHQQRLPGHSGPA